MSDYVQTGNAPTAPDPPTLESLSKQVRDLTKLAQSIFARQDMIYIRLAKIENKMDVPL